MAYLIDPFGEFSYHWHEIPEGNMYQPQFTVLGGKKKKKSKQRDAGEKRLAGFDLVLEEGAETDENSSRDEICGLDVLGLPPPKSRRPLGQVFRGRQSQPQSGASRLTKQQAAKLHPTHAAPDAFRSAVKAHRAGLRAIEAAKTQFGVVAHKVLGAASVLLGETPSGVAAVSRAPLTPKQKAAFDRYNKAAQKSKSAGETATKKGQNAVAQAQKTRGAIAQSSQAVRALLSKQVRMHGDDGGDDGGAPPDAPVTPPQDLSVAVDSVPGDGVVYDGKKGWPRYAFGSKSFFDTYKHSEKDAPPTTVSAWEGVFGYVWGFDQVNWPNSGDPPRWFAVNGVNHAFTGTVNWEDMSKQPGDPQDASQVAANAQSNVSPTGRSFAGQVGPLIGNPLGDLANLRWARADKKWFWYLEQAPDWATAELRYRAQKIAQEKAASDKAAADADAATQAKTAADQAAQQAAQDFQNALAEKQAQSEANVADTKRQSQQADLAQQQAQQQAQLDAQSAQQNLDQQKQQADIEAEQQKIWLDYLQQHPELMAPQTSDAQQQDPYALPGAPDGGWGGGLPGAGAPDFRDQGSIDQAFQQAEDAGAALSQAQPFYDASPEGATPDLEADREQVTPNPADEMLGRTPRGTWR